MVHSETELAALKREVDVLEAQYRNATQPKPPPGVCNLILEICSFSGGKHINSPDINLNNLAFLGMQNLPASMPLKRGLCPYP